MSQNTSHSSTETKEDLTKLKEITEYIMANPKFSITNTLFQEKTKKVDGEIHALMTKPEDYTEQEFADSIQKVRVVFEELLAEVQNYSNSEPAVV